MRIPQAGDMYEVTESFSTAADRIYEPGDKLVLVEHTDDASEWNQPDMMWPDDWSRWQRALDDALPWGRQVDLRDL